MESDQSPDGKATGQVWLTVSIILLALTALLWSVDASIGYLLLGGATFSGFKFIYGEWLLKRGKPDSQPYTHRQQDQRKKFSDLFNQTSNSLSSQQKKLVLAVIFGISGFVFFIIFISVLFGARATDTYSSENYLRASDYYNSQQYDSAAYYYGLALQGDPENANLCFERGNAFLNANKPELALRMYDSALAIQPDFQQARYNKGYVYYLRKDYRSAIQETKKVLEYNPDYTDAMLMIGDCFYNQSQLDSALTWYEGAYERGYSSAILCHLMAYIYDVKGNTTIAIDLYKEAIEQDSTIKDIYVRLGELVPGQEGEMYRMKASRLN